MLPKNVDLKTFTIEDLVGKTLEVRSYKYDGIELIVAADVKTGDAFYLREGMVAIVERDHEKN